MQITQMTNFINKINNRLLYMQKRHALVKHPFFADYKPAVNVELANRVTVISTNFKFLYFKIFKAANLTVLNSLYATEVYPQRKETPNITHIRDQHYKTISALNKEQTAFLKSEYYKFTFVRNPYNRFLSAYLDKVISNHTDKKEGINKFLGDKKDSEVTLDKFLLYLESGGLTKNGHWAPQSDLITYPINKLDFVGKVENITADLSFVLETIYNQPAVIKNKVGHSTNASSKTNMLSKSIKNRIYSLYLSDFDVFNYTK